MPQRAKQKSTSSSSVGAVNNCLNIPDYFRSSKNKESDKTESRLLTIKIYNAFSDIFHRYEVF